MHCFLTGLMPAGIDVWKTLLVINRQNPQLIKSPEGISQFMNRFHNLSLTGCQDVQPLPPISEGTRTKMLTHFLHHVTLIRRTLSLPKSSTLSEAERQACPSRPYCFFRETQGTHVQQCHLHTRYAQIFTIVAGGDTAMMGFESVFSGSCHSNCNKFTSHNSNSSLLYISLLTGLPLPLR